MLIANDELHYDDLFVAVADVVVVETELVVTEDCPLSWQLPL